jgi:hypothetical protein
MLAHENDMTAMPQFINPRRDTWGEISSTLSILRRIRNDRGNKDGRVGAWGGVKQAPAASHLDAAKSIPSLNNGRNIHADMHACGLSG